ncbi:MAG: ADP-forming succinate--CoA ligase subunit beta [Candidatus Atribacteria bacterium]|nr:MAG: ADP-forming succinate--CoA ligase subunit beta [Candidatus Atribacteria bacterium]
MRIHEYQAKQLFAKYGIPVSASNTASTVDEAVSSANALGYPVVVKAQIHAGGRGKGGGIELAKSASQVRDAATRMLGMTLVTPQTGSGGRIVRLLLIESAADIAQELYLGMAIDRGNRAITVMASRAGGVDIEETALRDPDAILKEIVDPFLGLRPFQAFRLAHRLGLPIKTARGVAKFIQSLYRLFCEQDCVLAEINPLAITSDGDPLAIDAKLNLDDNGLFRHPDLRDLRDLNEEDPLEVEATAVNLNYIKLDGTVGCLVNGAGLAMATMDLIKHVGASPANFLDVGGGATAEMIEKGVQILIGDPDVKAVFINIFGGILRCDVLAEGVVAAAKKLSILVPVIVRLEGTNVEQGRRILNESGLSFRTASSLGEAAVMVAAAVGVTS